MKKFFAISFSLVAAAALLVSFTWNNSSVGGVEVGDAAPAFELMNIDGNMVSLEDYANEKGVIVTFTCNHCPFSVMYEDRLIALDKQYKENGYPVIAINPNDATEYPDDSFDNMKKRWRDKGFTFPYLHDETQDIAKAYGAERTPHVYFLKNTKKKGFVVSYIGAIDDNARDAEGVKTKYVEKAIRAVEKGRTPDPATTKAIGCTIKWKKDVPGK
jgi:peroxiredoxin